jgi:hypothetical protein
MKKSCLKLSFLITIVLTFIYCGGAGDNNGGIEGLSTRVVIRFQDQACIDISARQEELARLDFDDIVTFILTVTGDDFSTIQRSFDVGEEIKISVLVGDPRNFMIEGFDQFGQLVCRGGVTTAILPGLNIIEITCILVEPTPTPTPSPSPTPTPTITPTPTPLPEDCDDRVDNDGDQLIDCADPDCEGQTGPQEQVCERPEMTCNDGADNDGDDLRDCADPSCEGQIGSCAELCEQPEQTCTDGFDNDGDGAKDCADTDCEGQRGPQEELCEIPEASCNDGSDNDGDGDADCGDTNCASAPNCNPETVCNDNIDNDLDGFTDCADSDCADDPNCSIIP